MKRTIGLLTALALLAPATAGANITHDPTTYRLQKVGLDAASGAQINAVARAWGRRVGIGELLANATQVTRPLDGGGGLPGDTVGGFRWADSNENESDWRPQGITGSADAQGDGKVAGHRELLVSWHSEPDAYSRITIVNADDLSNGKYRHVLLVAPKAGGGVDMLASHAGGVVWYKSRLYVADTGQLLVFDLGDLIKVKPARRNEVRTYDYILPLRGRYVPIGASPGFSSVSLDRSKPNHALITSQFIETAGGGHLARWPLNEKTGLMGKRVASSNQWTVGPITKVQGATMKNGRFALSTSFSSAPGALFTGPPRASLTQTPWPVGAESLHYAPRLDRLYSLTEFPGSRRVFAVTAASRGF